MAIIATTVPPTNTGEETPNAPESPEVTAIILDGAAIVQMLSPGAAKTIQDCAKTVFVPFVDSKLSQTTGLVFSR